MKSLDYQYNLPNTVNEIIYALFAAYNPINKLIIQYVDTIDDFAKCLIEKGRDLKIAVLRLKNYEKLINTGPMPSLCRYDRPWCPTCWTP
jgi:hypothetical protein